MRFFYLFKVNMKLFICVILFSVWVSCCCFPAASPELSQPNPDDDTNEVRVTDMPTALVRMQPALYNSIS